jgi:hypothetical protein
MKYNNLILYLNYNNITINKSTANNNLQKILI